MSHITTLVLTKGIVASIITLIIAFIGFTICSFFGLDTTGISYVAPFIGMWFAVGIGDFSIDTVHGVDGGFLSNASSAKIVAVLSILSLIVFFIVNITTYTACIFSVYLKIAVIFAIYNTITRQTTKTYSAYS